MGNDSPKAENTPENKGFKSPNTIAEELEEDIYILEDLNKISLQPSDHQLYFWVDPKIFNSENQKYESFLKKHMDLQSFSSVEGLDNHLAENMPARKIKVICAASLQDEDYRRLQNDSRISAMFLFCQNQERAKLLRSNFPKIILAKFDIIQLKDAMLHIQQNQPSSSPRTNMLFMVEDDTNLMNRYRINFYSLTCRSSAQAAKKDFSNFIRKLYEKNADRLPEFESNYKLGLSSEERTEQALTWMSREPFFIQSTQQLPRVTTDPKKLGYLRFPFKECYDAIVSSYRKKPKKVGEFYMVLTPNPEELEKLRVNQNNYIIFTSFARGFTTQKAAKKVQKSSPNSFLCRVMIPTLTNKVIESLDFGYWIDSGREDGGPNILFNLYNVFKIQDFEEDLNQVTLEYGSLADVAFKREKNRNEYRLTPHEERLMRNYDYLEDIISGINSQATVLQMSGYFKESIEVYDRKFQYIRKSQPSQEVLDKHTIEMGDVYMMNQDFKLAQQQYLSVKDPHAHLLALVHLAELYLRTHEKKKLENVINEIQRNFQGYKQISNPESFKAQNFVGLELMNRQKYREASQLFKQLTKDAAIHYDYKYEGIPLVHDIFRNRAACETKLRNYQEALSLLDSTKDWQKVCEGSKSPGLLITETLIKSVHLSRGAIAESQQSEAEIQRIRQSVSHSDNMYLNRSNVLINLDESSFHIDISNAPKQVPKKEEEEAPKREETRFEQKPKGPSKLPPIQNLNESNFHIETSAPKMNLKESAINIDI